MSLPLNQVVLGDCIEVMREWPENSVDCIVTDPPYGLGFMGKEWDKFEIHDLSKEESKFGTGGKINKLPRPETRGLMDYFKPRFSEMFRVLKPGALAFVMSSPRQDVLWRMLSMLEGVGFQLRQSAIFWVYRTGFPKSYDVSKGIDRKLGLKRKITGRSPHFSPGRQRTWGDGVKYGTQKGTDAETDWVSEPASDLAKKWSGWKSQTGLKPAVEMILMVNKPRSEPTIVDNVLKWGTGAINVDACRIPISEAWKRSTPYKEDIRGNSYNRPDNPKLDYPPQEGDLRGRFPANLLISSGALDRPGETTKSGLLEPHHHISEERAVYGEYAGRESISSYGDEGSPYRFFDLDAWSEHHGFLDVAKPSKAERDMGLWTQPLRVPKSKFNLNDGSKDMRFDGVIPTPRRNIHPTTKPIRLMAYLITLGCPPDGVVVDPFLGSGTTCIAAKRLRRKWIGIEINPEYAEIAEARINIKGPLDQYLEDKLE